MICSTCDTEVEEYYRGHQCKLCFRIPQKTWRKKNRKKEREAKNRRYKKDPQRFIAAIAKWRAKNGVYYGIHLKLRQRYDTIHLKDTYVRKRVRQLVGPTHVITDQEIDERRQQIIRWRQKRVKVQETESKTTVYCLMVMKKIPTDTCQSVQVNYSHVCDEDCAYRGDPDKGLEVKDRLKVRRE